MPTRAQIENADPLTSFGASMLLTYLRASQVYKETPGAYPTLEADLTALVDVDSIKSKFLSATCDLLESVGDGTVGVRGGKFGALFSTVEEREQALSLALNVLYDTAIYGNGISVQGAASARMNCPTGEPCCPFCGYSTCLPVCLGYRVGA